MSKVVSSCSSSSPPSSPPQEKVSLGADLSLDWDEEMAKAQPHDCVPLPSNHPLYVLYTSGTTGTPKVPEEPESLEPD